MDPVDELKRWRGDKSLAKAGALIKCDPSLLRRLENRANKPGLELAIRIRNVVGIPIEAWADEKPSSESGEHNAAPESSEPAA